MKLNFESPDARAVYAEILRQARQLRKKARAKSETFPEAAYFLGVQAALALFGRDRLLWQNDLDSDRSPLDFSRDARWQRRHEMWIRRPGAFDGGRRWTPSHGR